MLIVYFPQLEAFTSFGIQSVVVNEDTPNDAELWKVRDSLADNFWLIIASENCRWPLPKHYHDYGVNGKARRTL